MCHVCVQRVLKWKLGVARLPGSESRRVRLNSASIIRLRNVVEQKILSFSRGSVSIFVFSIMQKLHGASFPPAGTSMRGGQDLVSTEEGRNLKDGREGTGPSGEGHPLTMTITRNYTGLTHPALSHRTGVRALQALKHPQGPGRVVLPSPPPSLGC